LLVSLCMFLSLSTKPIKNYPHNDYCPSYQTVTSATKYVNWENIPVNWRNQPGRNVLLVNSN